MAFSRLERIGSIYKRITSLIEGGSMKKEEKPLWYPLYEAFPPKDEPTYDRAVPYKPVTEIFYKEDITRAKFHKDITNLSAIDLTKEEVPSETQEFLLKVKTLEEDGLVAEEAYKNAIEIYKNNIKVEQVEATPQQNVNKPIDVKSLLLDKDE